MSKSGELTAEAVRQENARRAEEQAKKAARLASAYRATFETPPGREVWEDLQRVCFMARSTVPEDQRPLDAHAVLVNEGARTVCLYIADQIAAGRKVQDEQAPTQARTSLM